MAVLIILPPAAKYLKKLKNKPLKKLYDEAIKEICKDPTIGEPKHGDLEKHITELLTVMERKS